VRGDAAKPFRSFTNFRARHRSSAYITAAARYSGCGSSVVDVDVEFPTPMRSPPPCSAVCDDDAHAARSSPATAAKIIDFIRAPSFFRVQS
jgi:hypothetical protein